MGLGASVERLRTTNDALVVIGFAPTLVVVDVVDVVDDVVDVVDDDLVDLSRDLFFASILMARLFGSCNADLFFVRVVLAFITCGFTSCLLEDALLMFFVTTGAMFSCT